jgi:hypothetical protein
MVLVSCNTPPEAYEKGMNKMNEKDWDKAIEAFNLVTEQDENWLDSADKKKDLAFSNLLKEGKWKKIFRVLEKYRDDDNFYSNAIDSIQELYFRLVKIGKADSVLELTDINKSKLIEHIDSLFTNKVIKQCEDSIFCGVWIGLGYLKGQEVYFKRNENELHAFSNKSLRGWQKDAIIYKDLRYSGGKLWKVKPKIFQIDYWGSDKTYFSKKGQITILSSDTFLIDYDVLNRESKFYRKR